MSETTGPFDAALGALALEGLNWVAFVPAADGPAWPGRGPTGPNSGLLLFLALGSAFGARTRFGDGAGGDPFDDRSRQLVTAFAERWLTSQAATSKLVYPGDAQLDLRAWLQAGRVQHRSRIGIGIRPDCGPWMAVRAAVWTRLSDAHRELVTRRYPPLGSAPSPCEHCEDPPCVRACPAGAVSDTPHPPSAVRPRALDLCIDHRIAPESSCARSCLARLACPIGTAYRYPEDQLRYHYGVSLDTVLHWRRGRPT